MTPASIDRFNRLFIKFLMAGMPSNIMRLGISAGPGDVIGCLIRLPSAEAVHSGISQRVLQDFLEAPEPDVSSNRVQNNISHLMFDVFCSLVFSFILALIFAVGLQQNPSTSPIDPPSVSLASTLLINLILNPFS